MLCIRCNKYNETLKDLFNNRVKETVPVSLCWVYNPKRKL